MDENGVPVKSEGEVTMHNCTYTQTRFPFSYAWWGAFNWKRKCKDNLDICGDQPMPPTCRCLRCAHVWGEHEAALVAMLVSTCRTVGSPQA